MQKIVHGAVSFLLGGCVSGAAQPPVSLQLPAEWPPIATVSVCADLTGVYDNAAVATTLRNRNSAPWLSALLENGGLKWSSETNGIDGRSKITIELTSLTVTISRATPLEPIELRVTAPSTCLGDGSVQIRFPQYEGGGEAALADVSSIVARLYRASDGALLVHWIGYSRGVTFPAVPYDVTHETWLLFRRAGSEGK
jgi:hypothetical protein